MIGAIAGDIIGSRFERHNYTKKDFELFDKWCRFTDDTVLTCATAHALLTDRDYAKAYRNFFAKYPERGYGPLFKQWAGGSIKEPYHSIGNGSAMRVGPIGWAFDTLDEVLTEARRSAEVTHNSPEGIKGAQAVAAAVFLSRQGHDKDGIRKFVTEEFGYDLIFTIDWIRGKYRFDATCDGSVPQAIVAFLESESFEDALRNAVSIGGDSDTIAAITGSIAEAFYKCIPINIVQQTNERLDNFLGEVLQKFQAKFSQSINA